jgi:hypothetical protein
MRRPTPSFRPISASRSSSSSAKTPPTPSHLACCNSLRHAPRLFDEILFQSSATWNSRSLSACLNNMLSLLARMLRFTTSTEHRSLLGQAKLPRSWPFHQCAQCMSSSLIGEKKLTAMGQGLLASPSSWSQNYPHFFVNLLTASIQHSLY